MTNEKNYRLAGLFLLFFLLVNYPLLGIFNKKGLVWGFPMLYFYLFSVWFFVILGIWFITKNKK